MYSVRERERLGNRGRGQTRSLHRQTDLPHTRKRAKPMTVRFSERILEELRKAKAEGKVLPPLAERALEEKTLGKGTTKIAAALYLLGASLSQITVMLGIKRPTVWSYVRDHIPQKVRELRGKDRRGAYEPLIEMIDVEAYYEEFQRRKGELIGLDAVMIAAKLKQTVKVEEREEDKLEPE